MESKRALITGITGQDGSYLAELLLEKGYEVYGIVRRLSKPNVANIEGILDELHLIDGDLMDQSSLNAAVGEAKPEEVYNLAAQTFAHTSFIQPVLTGEVTGLGAVRVLEAVRHHAPGARMYQASSSEMFGKVDMEPQNELTPFHPRSPYGVAKVYAHHACVNYREAYHIHVSTGILFNHESERRGFEFITRKISHNVAKIHLGLAGKVELGNIQARRDWGYAPEYADLMWRVLQLDYPDDFVGATGESHSVEEVLGIAFGRVGIENWDGYVSINQRYFRPVDIQNLRGDITKARQTLGWEPKTSFEDLINLMVDHDLKLLRGFVAN